MSRSLNRAPILRGAPPVRNGRVAFVHGRRVQADVRTSWHFVQPRAVRVVTEGLAETRARDVARRGGDYEAELARMLALVNQPIEVLFQ